MKKALAIFLVTSVFAGCAGPQYGAGPQYPPTVNGSIYAGSHGAYGRVGVSTGNFGINIGF